jgi:hypothetical protein
MGGWQAQSRYGRLLDHYCAIPHGMVQARWAFRNDRLEMTQSVKPVAQFAVFAGYGWPELPDDRRK